ncbi:hypothetical protein Acr_29g0008440 [Actinidia rufa]|uniref:Uncharacterized protein n=1 Tax=Actinidia rufa TaxID=165716 RepID=A0A7J0HF53_9ERIC|nr:hypothetical protein Acr_29g0008440 [Actinidia rufa]
MYMFFNHTPIWNMMVPSSPPAGSLSLASWPELVVEVLFRSIMVGSRSWQALVDEAWSFKDCLSGGPHSRFCPLFFLGLIQPNSFQLFRDDQAAFPWENLPIIRDIREWALEREWSFQWCKRHQNRSAHWPASKALLDVSFSGVGGG